MFCPAPCRATITSQFSVLHFFICKVKGIILYKVYELSPCWVWAQQMTSTERVLNELHHLKWRTGANYSVNFVSSHHLVCRFGTRSGSISFFDGIWCFFVWFWDRVSSSSSCLHLYMPCQFLKGSDSVTFKHCWHQELTILYIHVRKKMSFFFFPRQGLSM